MFALAAPEGHYYLSGVRDVGGELRLGADQRFEWSLMYGAINRYARGQWHQDGNTVTLTAEKPAGEPPLALCDEAAIRLKRPAEADSWLAIVGMPDVGPISYPLAVVFEDQTGRQWRRRTDQAGEAMLKAPRRAIWQRIGLRRAESQSPWQWFRVPAKRRAARVVCVAVNDPLWAMPLPFAELRLTVRGSQLETSEGWVYRLP